MKRASAVDAPWQRYGWMMGAIWLIFLAFPVIELITGEHPVLARVGGLVGIGAFCAVYIHGLVTIPDAPGSDRAHRGGIVHIAVMAGLTAVVCVAAGDEGFSTLPYVVALAILSLRLPYATGVVATAVAVPLILRFTGVFPPGSEFIVFIVVLVATATAIVRFVDVRQHEHHALENELHVVAERDRVARDLHDILGHSLTVVALKAELASRLFDSDPERARGELQELRSLTRETLADIRATVSGLRVLRLRDEVESAVTALSDAGVTVEIHGSVDDVDPRHRHVLAWVLRESVTNVLRHSRAERCTISFAADGMVIADDGVGMRGTGEGDGIEGMRDRVANVGGVFHVLAGEQRGTRVEVTL